MTHDVTIKVTGLSPEEVQKLIDSLGTITAKITVKPALKQANVIGSKPKRKPKAEQDPEWFSKWCDVIKRI